MTESDKDRASNSDGWMPPRGGGYRPGKNTTSIPPTRTSPPGPPPKGPAGVTKSGSRRGN
jgi:hypothetical protein